MAATLGYDSGLTCSLDVTDLDAAVRWYEDVLGFKLLYKTDAMGWCELESPMDRTPTVSGDATLVFGVLDIDRTHRELEARQVRFDGEIRIYEGMVRLATFHDPDGNTLMIYQSLSE